MDQGKRTLLIVEDDPGLQSQLKWHFCEDYEVHCAGDYDAAIEALRLFEPSVVIQDLGLPPHEEDVLEGFRTMQQILRLSRHTKIIVVTGTQGTEHALRAVSLGAYDFYPKPIDTKVLDLIVDRAFQMHDLEKQNKSLLQQETSPLTGLVTSNPTMLNICHKLEKIASTDVTCLLFGESGTGKELFARAIHELSARKGQAFVAINCAAIPDSLIESELFGYEKGAFTGADKRTIGKIESAQGGTLFLDELGDMPLVAQAKLLRFIQERIIERVGGRVEITVDVRIVCATNKDLKKLTSREAFREDLYFRVSDVVVNIPPLRDRGEDKLLLSRHFLNKIASEYNRDIVNFDETAIASIDAYKWPGNVRELIAKVKNAVVMADGRFISALDLQLEDVGELALNLKHVREGAERTAIQKALTISKGKITSAARLLGVTRPTLYDLLKRYNIKNNNQADLKIVDKLVANSDRKVD
ncbi:MAG: PEP-CTERM-box response regulator transcription factor [Pseudomonadales bacterium]|nr:PEP-CTERM-box response regulator transcription factor [Pseudomonadales bacterium]